LGTERVRTASGGTAREWCVDTPYGMNLACNLPDDSPMHFTGKQRDTETGLDYFGARYNESVIGRFMTPDPFIPFNLKKDKFQAWISNPQHWNKYAYALNNPLLYVDPTGMTETIYYWLNSNLTDEQKKYFNEHKTEILNAIADKLKEAGIKDVVFKDGTTLSKSQFNSILETQPKGVAFLNFANKSFGSYKPDSDTFGSTGRDGIRSVVFVGNLQAGNPSASDLSFRISEVSDHELGHGMGFYSRDWYPFNDVLNSFSNDIMNEGRGIPKSSNPLQWDMSIPQNRQAVDEINKLPEYTPQQ
jgi:RHS repeat-associated protein